MEFNGLNINIKEYLGIFNTGVIVILSIIHDSKVYEGIYWYTADFSVIQLPQDLETLLGGKVEELEYYNGMLSFMKESVEKYDEIFPKLTDIMRQELPQ